jgi:hypothetical protein
MGVFAAKGWLALGCVVVCGAAASAVAAPTSAATSGSVQRPVVPAGWTPVQQDELVLALPPGFTARPAGSGMPGAAAQWTDVDEPALAAPAVAVFVETGQVGPLELRTDLVSRARSAQLGVAPALPPRAVRVPGSVAARVLEWSWEQPVGGTRPVASRQVELVVQAAGRRQYGVLLGGPSWYLTDQLVHDVEGTVAVLAPEAGS